MFVCTRVSVYVRTCVYVCVCLSTSVRTYTYVCVKISCVRVCVLCVQVCVSRNKTRYVTVEEEGPL